MGPTLPQEHLHSLYDTNTYLADVRQRSKEARSKMRERPVRWTSPVPATPSPGYTLHTLESESLSELSEGPPAIHQIPADLLARGESPTTEGAAPGASHHLRDLVKLHMPQLRALASGRDGAKQLHHMVHMAKEQMMKKVLHVQVGVRVCLARGSRSLPRRRDDTWRTVPQAVHTASQEMMRAQQHAINNYGSQSVTRRGFNKPWVELVVGMSFFSMANISYSNPCVAQPLVSHLADAVDAIRH